MRFNEEIVYLHSDLKTSLRTTNGVEACVVRAVQDNRTYTLVIPQPLADDFIQLVRPCDKLAIWGYDNQVVTDTNIRAYTWLVDRFEIR